MKLFGITGGIGMGKSTCAALLRKQGTPVIDTDDLARALVQPGQPALAEIGDAFGSKVIDDDGRLRRSVLADLVFSDSDALKKLESILHPRIRSAWSSQVEQWRLEKVPLAGVVMPLLFETAAQSHFDVIVCVACTPATQLNRLSARGWSASEVERRSAAQWPVAEKMAAANFVIWTEGEMAAHAAQVARVFHA